MRFIVGTEDAGQRLDQYLALRLRDHSRSQIQRLIQTGHVQVAPGKAKPGLVVAADVTVDVQIPPPEPPTPEAEPLPLTILYEDADLVVIDKPAGMVVHPGAGHRQGTVVNALLHHVGGLSGIGGVARPGIVHRLDRGTSGVMVVAKHDTAHQDLARQFHDRTVEKIYLALVWGRLAAGQRLEQPIGRDRRDRQKMSTRSARTRTALTEIVSVEPLRGVTLAHIRIGTGRTHQIRVHLSEIGHPLVGDDLYGGSRAHPRTGVAGLGKLGRPFLHAARLTLTHPRTQALMTFEAPLPADLTALLEALRRAA
jgi:23S rRNA pseudouridine1911/1915/1917 synthase